MNNAFENTESQKPDYSVLHYAYIAENGHQPLNQQILDEFSTQESTYKDIPAEYFFGQESKTLRLLVNRNDSLNEEDIAALAQKSHTRAELYQRSQLLIRGYESDQSSSQIALEVLNDKFDAPFESWEDVALSIFEGNNGGALKAKLIELNKTLGYYPDDLWSTDEAKKALAEPATMQYIVRFLQGGSRNKNAFVKSKSELERSYFLTAAIQGGLFDQFPQTNDNQRPFTLDHKGLRIWLSGVHSHIPAAYIDDKTLTCLFEGNHISEAEYHELRKRNRKDNFEWEESQELDIIQLEHFFSELLDSITSAEDFWQKYASKPDQLAEDLVSTETVIPDILIEQAIQNNRSHAQYFFFRVGDVIGQIAADSVEDTLSFDFRQHALSTYSVRRQIMNQSGYYNVIKVARAFLSYGLPARVEDLVMFKGDFKREKPSGGGVVTQNSFLEVMYQGEQARMLINEGQLLNSHHEELQDYPVLNRNQYDIISGGFIALSDFYSTVATLSKKVSPNVPLSGKDSQLLAAINHFVVSHDITRRDQRMIELETKLGVAGLNENELSEWYQLLNQAGAAYEEYLRNHIYTGAHEKEKELPSIVKVKYSFGPSDLELLKEQNPGVKYEAELYNEAYGEHKFRLVYIKNPITNQPLPLPVLMSALEKLGVRKNKPVINVIGGMSQVGQGHHTPVHQFSQSIINVAHDYAATVTAPGTQAGIGHAMGLRNLEYLKIHATTSHHDRMHMVSITPAGGTGLIDSPFQFDTQNRRALSPMDQIITNVDPKWGQYERDQDNVIYENQVALMQAAYLAMSMNTKQIVPVVNGGFYGMVDINEMLRQDAGMIFAADTGRLSQATAFLIDSPETIRDLISAPDDDFVKIFSEYLSQPKYNRTDSMKEFLTKDFGPDLITQDPKYWMFRNRLRTYINLLHQKSHLISVTSLAQMEEELYRRLG